MRILGVDKIFTGHWIFELVFALVSFDKLSVKNNLSKKKHSP